jgi:hypothetical protein
MDLCNYESGFELICSGSGGTPRQKALSFDATQPQCQLWVFGPLWINEVDQQMCIDWVNYYLYD